MLFDHLVGAAEQRHRNVETERVSGLEVDHQFEFGRALHWQVGGLLALKDAIDVASSLPAWIDRVRSIRNQPTVSNEDAEWVGCWQSVSRCERDDQTAIIKHQRGSDRDQTAVRSASKFSNAVLDISACFMHDCCQNPDVKALLTAL
jgi:hypothetical protein